MPDYRLYCLSERGTFSKVHEIDAKDDDQAVAKAKALHLPVKCELWHRDRMVTTLDPSEA